MFSAKRSLSKSAVIALMPLALMTQYANAEDCYAMLKPTFDFAKATGDGKIHHVWATATKHHAFGPKYPSMQASILYSWGQVFDGHQFWGDGQFKLFVETLSGDIQTRSNKAHDNNMDIFAPGSLTLKLAVNPTGGVSLQEKLNGNPIGGMPPQYYQGDCSSGLIRITILEGTSWAISFHTSLEDPGPK